MEARTTTLEPSAIEREGSSDELLARLPVKSLTALLGGLAALGLADSADAMVSDGGSASKSSKSGGDGTSKSSSASSSASAKQTPASQASPPANTSSDRESGSSSAVSQGAQRSSSASGARAGASAGASAGSSKSSGSGSSSAKSSGSGSSGSSGGDPANVRGLRGPSGQSSKGASSKSSSKPGSSGSSSSSGSPSSSSSRTLDRPAASREGRSDSDDREASSSGALSRGAKRSSSSGSGSSASSRSSGSSSPSPRTDASDGYAGIGAGAGASAGAGTSKSQSSDSDSKSSDSSGSSRVLDRPAASREGRSFSDSSPPPPRTKRAPGDSLTPAWTGAEWPAARGRSDRDDEERTGAKRPSSAPKGVSRGGPGGDGLPTPPAHDARPAEKKAGSAPKASRPSRDAGTDDFDYSYGENDLQNEWLETPGVVYGGGPYGNGQMHSTPPSRRRSTRVDPDSIPGPPRPGGLFDFGYPEEGPSLADFPKGPIGLPYEGQEGRGLSCSRSGADPRGCNDFVPNGKPKSSGKLGVEGSVVKTDGQTEVLRGDGSTRSTLSLSTNLRIKGKAEAKSRRRFGFGLNGSVGRTSSYSVSVDDPDRADAIANGEEKAPNPHDPTSLKVNEGLTISKENYLGGGAEAAYKELRLAVNREAGDRVSSGVTRVNKRRVRVDVGDEETVRQSIEVGLEDPTGLVGLSVEGGDEQASGRKRSVTLDVKTRRGWEAYQRFIVTGKLPSPESKAVKRMSNTDDENWKSTIGSKGKLGPVKWDSSEVSRIGNESVTRYRNGKVERSWVDKTYGVGGAVSTAIKPNGKQGKSSYAVSLEDVPDDAANDFLEARGQKADRGGDQDMTIRYSKADLWQLRGEARNLILAESDDDTTIEDVNRDLADGEREEVGGHVGVDTAQDVLAMTKSPEAAIKAISATGLPTAGTSYMGDAEQFLGWLEHHEERVGERDTRPGRAALVTDASD